MTAVGIKKARYMGTPEDEAIEQVLGPAGFFRQEINPGKVSKADEANEKGVSETARKTRCAPESVVTTGRNYRGRRKS